MKTRIVLALLFACAVGVLAQAEKVKGKAKDLKKNIEGQQTNSPSVKTNAPAKLH